MQSRQDTIPYLLADSRVLLAVLPCSRQPVSTAHDFDAAGITFLLHPEDSWIHGTDAAAAYSYCIERILRTQRQGMQRLLLALVTKATMWIASLLTLKLRQQRRSRVWLLLPGTDAFTSRLLIRITI
jgi:hypothetical protein